MSGFADRLARLEDAPPARLGIALGAAVLLSTLALWIASGSIIAAGSYAGGVVAIGLGLVATQRLGRSGVDGQFVGSCKAASSRRRTSSSL